MPNSRCEVCGVTGTLAAGRSDRLLVVRVVDMMPPMVKVTLPDFKFEEPVYPGKILTTRDVDTEFTFTPPLRELLTIHLRCIPSWLEEHPELAITSSRPSDI